MKRTLASALVLAIVALGIPVGLQAAPRRQPSNGSVSGTAQGADQTPLPGYRVNLRCTSLTGCGSNMATGQVRSTTTNGSGEFLFNGLDQGTYVVEIVDATGKFIGVSVEITLGPGAMAISGLLVSATAAGTAAAAAAAGGLGAFFSSTAGIVLIAAAGAGITAGILSTRPTASPSR